MRKRRTENRFRFRPLLAFGGGVDTIEGMSLAHLPVNIALAMLIGLPAVGHAREQVSEDPTETAPYIVAPFENGSPLAALDWMSTALAVTLAEKLEAHPSLRPVYGGAIVDGFGKAFDPEKVAQRAHDLGARWVFGGAFSRPDWKSEMRVRLYAGVEASDTVPRPTLRMVAAVGSTGEQKALLDQLDANLFGVLQKMSWTLDGESIALMKRRPTKDLYAFTLYGLSLIHISEPTRLLSSSYAV